MTTLDIHWSEMDQKYWIATDNEPLWFDSILEARRAARQIEIDAAVRAERDRIVSWLRGQEAIGFERMHRADTPTSQRSYAAGAEAVKRCADAIEAGEHLQ